MKKTWEKNRLETYKGSFMHYLRSVYANAVTSEGFITNQLFSAHNIKNDPVSLDKIAIDPRPLRYDTLATVIDTSFISLKSPDFYLTYDPKKLTPSLKSPLRKIKYTLNWIIMVQLYECLLKKR
ncbi:hypothetical protein [Mucilaginibacter humi]|nr:hypothetical protein [Mucilaginibacter humi]